MDAPLIRLARGLRLLAGRAAHRLPPYPSAPTPTTSVQSLTWEGDKLRITGWAYVPKTSVRDARFHRVRLVLRGSRFLPPISVRTRPVEMKQATWGAKGGAHNYDLSGFVAEIPAGRVIRRFALLSLVRRRRATSPMSFRVEARVWSRGIRSAADLGGAAQGRAQRPAVRRASDGRTVRPVWVEGKLRVVARAAAPSVTSVTLVDGVLRITGTAPVKGRLRLGEQKGDITITEGNGFVGELAVPEEGFEGVLRLEPGGALELTGDEARFDLGDGLELAVARDRQDRVQIAVRPHRAVLTSAAWDGDELVLAGTYGGVPANLVLRHSSGAAHSMPVDWSEKDFSVRLSPTRVPRFGELVPLASGTWKLSLEDAGLRFDHAALPDEAPVELDGRVHTMLAIRHDEPALVVAESKPEEERGASGQRHLQRSVYPGMRQEPLREAVFYVCWNGQQYSDSVRAIYEELVRREVPVEHVWLVKDGAFVPPGPATVVRAGSREHYTAIARSRFIVTNTYLPKWAKVRDDQTCVQTWHGTPLKQIGNDMPSMQVEPKPEFWHRQAAEVPNWDLLISQTPWATPIFKRAFAYDGPILECGYPRNDVLFSGDAAAIRTRLGILMGQKVVLYAPTWRKSGETLELRFGVPDDQILLVRGHLMQSRPGLSGPGLLDVTTYPDIGELLLIADVLITDYSSVMFDFASTGRPILFFTYDLDEYRDSTRGFYFDFADEAPGPLLRTGAEVTAALRDLDTIAATYADAHKAFAAKYCPLDDGHAAARLVDHVWPA